MVGVLGTMDRGEDVVTGLEPEALASVARTRDRFVCEQGLGHDVADEGHALGEDALALQVLARLARRCEQQRCELVRDQAVYLFGHGHVEGAQARLQMDDGDAELGRRKSACERGVHVADDHDAVRRLLFEEFFEPDHRGAGLNRMRARAHPEMPARLRYGEVLEEDVGHHVVVMLTGVYQIRLVTRLGECRHERAHLDEVRPGADDDYEPHHVPSPKISSSKAWASFNEYLRTSSHSYGTSMTGSGSCSASSK